MKLAITLLAFAAIIGIGMAALLADVVWRNYAKRRERKALAKRDREMRRWGMKPFDQGRERVKS